ncbi:hypothetical protein KDA_06110 [Dictyobacter alpinus]|uniref:Uncharacterized protein n=1 Tax=Dictyobacter alpinus TaxID=2014873 RepID=A0A402B1E2_9CHLR|nr:hypothetical protein [Dictyobacter alpinus]GCE25127.1 hypothetical protein KDA_06110 [Dictyobacter alpinus]
MQQETITQMTNQEPSTYVTLLTIQRKVGITRRTLKKYLTNLSIEAICFPIGMRRLYISRETMELVKHIKAKPILLAHLPSPRVLLTEREEGKTLGFGRGKDTSNGI